MRGWEGKGVELRGFGVGERGGFIHVISHIGVSFLVARARMDMI